ncbi:MAG: nucleotide sugar epimerase [Chloroflexi bacterium]|nr:nucleotide sugar epimerase [Chloroflexota bacterium]
MKILVTGCAGFIGSRVVKELALRGDQVIGVDNLVNSYDPRVKQWRVDNVLSSLEIDWVNLDITESGDVSELVSETSPDVVINLAAQAGVRQSIEDPNTYYSTNVIGVINLLEACKRSGVSRFLQASTSSVYGANQMPFVEDAIIDSMTSPYATSKKAAEDLCRLYSDLFGINVTVFRFFTVYGPAGRPDMSIFRFVKWIAEGSSLHLNGDGTQQRDFTHVDDVVRGVLAALDNNHRFEIFNLGSDRPTELNRIIDKIEVLLGRSASIEQHPLPDTDVTATWANISRSREILNWEPQISLDEGLKTVVDWYRNNDDWVKEVEV